MTDRQRNIIGELRNTVRREVPVFRLAYIANAPEPSVRRDIHQLRYQGWDIRFESYGYKLYEPITATAKKAA